jgi:hypothetical protein
MVRRSATLLLPGLATYCQDVTNLYYKLCQEEMLEALVQVSQLQRRTRN